MIRISKKCQRVTKHYKDRNRRSYSCGVCGKHMHPTAGTIYHRSRVPLTDWFYAVYMMSSNKAGTSAMQIQRELGVTYKTAWRMMHQIRTMMDAPDVPLEDEVEIDETFVHANTFKRSSARKRYGFDARRKGEVVFGIVQRGGSVKVWHVKSTGARVLQPIIRSYVKSGSTIHTDGYLGYRRLPQMGYKHHWTDHSKFQFYTPESSTQNIENVWSHFKRGIKGVYRHIDKKYIQAYANEYAWRYSHRNATSMFWALMEQVSSERPS